jgi:hypothetical protein
MLWCYRNIWYVGPSRKEAQNSEGTTEDNLMKGLFGKAPQD